MQIDHKPSAFTVALRGGTEAELELVQQAMSFALFAAYRIFCENAFLRDALSITTESTAAYGVEGLGEANDLEGWRPVCKQIVQQSSRKTSQKRVMAECVDFVSPHMSGWTPSQAHSTFEQRRDPSAPFFTPCDVEAELPETGVVAQVSHDILNETGDGMDEKEGEHASDIVRHQSRHPESQVTLLLVSSAACYAVLCRFQTKVVNLTDIWIPSRGVWAPEPQVI